jgi:hypothetical protein
MPQLVVKIVPHQVDDGHQILDRHIGDVLNTSQREQTTVSRVFPEVAKGGRAGLFTIDLPDDVDEERVATLLRTLREDNNLEYAQTPARRDPA